MTLEMCSKRAAVVGIVFLLALVGAAPSLAVTNVYSSGNIAVAIPDNNGTGAAVTISVPDLGTITDVNVRIRLNHTNDGDLALGLDHANSGLALSNNNGGTGDNFGSGANDCSGTMTVFDSGAATSITAGTAPFAGTFQPQSGLSIFNGLPLQGDWIVRVIDSVAGNTGTIGCVQLEITFDPPPCQITCPTNIAVSNDVNQCGAVVSYPAPTTTGACETVICTPASGSFFPVTPGGTTVTCSSSGQNNASCTFAITVNDTQPPTIGGLGNLTVLLPENQTQSTVTFAAPQVNDNCPGVTVVASPPSGSVFTQGNTVVTVSATDASNNTATATFLVQVVAFLKVPTMSEAALVVLALLLMGIVALRRSRRF